MKKRVLFLLFLLAVMLFFFLKSYKYLIFQENYKEKGVKKNFVLDEKHNRNAADMILDTAFSVLGADRFSMMYETVIGKLERLKALYAKNDNFQRVKFMDQVMEELKVQGLIRENYAAYYQLDKPYEIDWKAIEVLLDNGLFEDAQKKIGVDPFFLANQANYYNLNNEPDKALELYEKSLSGLENEEDKSRRFKTFELILDGFVDSDQSDRAMEIYQARKDDHLKRLGSHLLKKFAEAGYFDYAFTILEDTADGLFNTSFDDLLFLAQAHIDQGKETLTERNRKILWNIMQKNKRRILKNG